MSDNKTVWRSRVAEWRTSGKTAELFATERGFSVSALRSWSSRIGRDERRLAMPSIRLARVLRPPATPERAAMPGSIVIELLGAQARIVVEGGVDRQALATVLEVVRGGAR